MNFPDKLRNLRKEKGLSQEELAKKIYVSRSLIARYENGTSLPNKENLEKIALFFSVEITELLDKEESVNIIINRSNTGAKIEKFFSILIIIVTEIFSLMAILPVFKLYGFVSMEWLNFIGGNRTNCIIACLIDENPITLITFLTCLINVALSITILVVKPFKNKIWISVTNYVLFVLNLFLICLSIYYSVLGFSGSLRGI